MNYAFARQVVPLDSARRDSELTIELYPAFAHLRPEPSWPTRLRVAFLAEQPLATDWRQVHVPAESQVSVPLPVAPLVGLPAGFEPLLRLTADAAGGPVAIWQGAW
jgi:hypothetical protein